MRILVSPVAALLCVAAAPCQTIDLNLWTIEQINGTGVWGIDAPRLRADFTNLVNTDCSVLISDFPVTFLEFSMVIDPSGGDDDLFGFLLGINPGDTTNPNSDYLMIDWKKTTQTYQNWGTCPAGLAISRVQGVPTRGYGNGPIDFWSHTGVCSELQRATNLGSTGWLHGTKYSFRVIFTPATVDIWVDGRQEFQLTGTFNPGRFAIYNYSQSAHRTQFPVAGAFTPVGTGCAGSAGTPLLFAPNPPMVGTSFPLVLSNLPPTAPTILALGFSNTSWQGLPLPLDLGILGAPGCTVHTSVDAMLFAVNTSGTAFISLQIPSTLTPSTAGPLLHSQGVVLDPTANALGLALSNAGSLTIGIR